jgi:hypothetical protein
MKKRTSGVVATFTIIGIVILLRLKNQDAHTSASFSGQKERPSLAAAEVSPENEIPVPLLVTKLKVLPALELPDSNAPEPSPGEAIESTHPAAARYQFDRLVGEWVSLLGRTHDAPSQTKSALKTQFRQEHALAIQAVEAASSGRIRFAEIGESGYPAKIEAIAVLMDQAPGPSSSVPSERGAATVIEDRSGQ